MVLEQRTCQRKAVPVNTSNLAVPVVDQSPTAIVSPDITDV